MAKRIEATVRFCRLDNLAEREQAESNCAIDLVKELEKAGLVEKRQFASGDEIVFQYVFKG